VQDLDDYIRRHAMERLSVPMLARRAGLSTFHFIRAFRAAKGMTPHQYLRHCRIERAKALLTTTLLPVTEICAAVGFSSVGSFSTLFRRLTGEPPTSYRRRRRTRPIVPGCFIRMYRVGR
jgi:transcriptional regulator GlxA family with amidase domain